MREQGKVRRFNRPERYGFINRSSGDDAFVHRYAVNIESPRTLNEGDINEFEVVKNPNGLQVKNVVVL